MAWYQSAVYCASRPIVGSGVGHPNKVDTRVWPINDIGVFLFRCHAYGFDSARAANGCILRALDEIACCGVLLGSDTSLRYRARCVEARRSLHPTSIRLVSDEGTSNSLDGCVAVSDSAASGCSISGVMLLALLYGTGESAARTLWQRLVDLVTSMNRVGGHIVALNRSRIRLCP